MFFGKFIPKRQNKSIWKCLFCNYSQNKSVFAMLVCVIVSGSAAAALIMKKNVFISFGSIKYYNFLVNSLMMSDICIFLQ